MKKVALVGFGSIGIKHAVSLLKLKGVDLVAIVNRNIDGIMSKISSVDNRYSISEIDQDKIKSINKYSTLSSCIKKESLDAIHICTHTDLHYKYAKTALVAGINVLLEKPMVLSLPQGVELIKLADNNGLLFMVGHVLRFMSPYSKLKEWIDKETYGKLNFLSLNRISGIPSWGQWTEKQRNFGSSGGALFDLLIHDIDFANYLFGNPDKINSSYFPGGLSPYDYVSALWTYDKANLKIKIEGGNIFHSAFPFQAGFMATFQDATVNYTTTVPEVIQVANNEKIIGIPVEDCSSGIFNEIEYFYECLESGSKPQRCLPDSSLEAVKICYQHINSTRSFKNL